MPARAHAADPAQLTVDDLRYGPGSLSLVHLVNALALLRGCLAAATARGGPIAGRPNHAEGLSLPRGARARTDAGWTWLRAGEVVRALGCQAIPFRARCFYAVLTFTGIRVGEACGLRWDDVDLERGVLHVRHSRREATKGGQPREVPLLGPARTAFEWLGELPRPRSHLGLVWPAIDGGPHADGWDAGWSQHRRLLALGRRVRIHDLRHTCASHLLQGSWAPEWIARPLRLEEVRDVLGHADITTTQRYAHLCRDAVAALVVGPARLDTGLDTTASHTPDLNRGPTVYEGEAGRRLLRAIEGVSVPVSRPMSSLAQEVLERVARGDVVPVALVVELAERAALVGSPHALPLAAPAPAARLSGRARARHR